MRRAGEDPEEVRQEDRRSSSAAVHPESAAAAVLHDGLDLEAGEGVREHHRVGVPAVGEGGGGGGGAGGRNIPEHGGGADDDAGDAERELHVQSFLAAAAQHGGDRRDPVVAGCCSHTDSVIDPFVLG